VQTWAVKGERLPACCSEAREADGQRDAERQIPKTADGMYCSCCFDRVDLAVVVVVVSSKEPWQRYYAQRVEDRPWTGGQAIVQPYDSTSSVERGRPMVTGERLPSKGRQGEQANTVGITAWAQPGQRTRSRGRGAQAKQRSTRVGGSRS